MLRAAALEVMQLAEHKRYCLNVPSASQRKPSPEVFSDEHRKTMLGKIADYFPILERQKQLSKIKGEINPILFP